LFGRLWKELTAGYFETTDFFITFYYYRKF